MAIRLICNRGQGPCAGSKLQGNARLRQIW